jgi:hypothetical protein
VSVRPLNPHRRPKGDAEKRTLEGSEMSQKRKPARCPEADTLTSGGRGLSSQERLPFRPVSGAV